MCGIVGFSGAFNKADLAAGVRAIAHRGPDDSGIFFDEQAALGLGNVRLSILDLSPLGHQPMTASDGAVVLTYNGEIYNFRKLRAQLEAKGHRFQSDSDTEVVLKLYLADGQAMLAKLDGIFAFAVWDSRNRTLFIARDALGIKPIYYASTHRGIAFASELKGLLPMVPEARELDAPSLHRYLSFLWCPGEGTPLKTVRKLPPGEALLVRHGIIERKWPWFELPAFRAPLPELSEQEAVDGTVSHLGEAVRRQMVADVPVGAFLSGGLDSSSVVSFAREINPDIRCFTIETTGEQDAGTVDDLPYAKRAAAHLRVKLDVVRVDAAQMASDLETMVAQLDEPLADPASLNVLYISRLARQQGMKVLLSGAGGDDIFTGYRRHLALRYESLWTWLPAPARKAFAAIVAKIDRRTHYGRRFNKFFSNTANDADSRLAGYFAWAREDDLRPLYTPEFRSAVGAERADKPMLDFLANISVTTSPVERMLALEQRFFLGDHNLLYTDKMSMAAGVEVRVPFLDLDLLNFASRIPGRYKVRGGTGKWILKKAMEPRLPRDVVYRPKTGFGAPLRRWMRNELRDLLGDLLSTESLRRRGLFEPIVVQRLIKANDAGRIDGGYTLLSLLCIEIWCRNFIDARAA